MVASQRMLLERRDPGRSQPDLLNCTKVYFSQKQQHYLLSEKKMKVVSGNVSPFTVYIRENSGCSCLRLGALLQVPPAKGRAGVPRGLC